MEPGRPFPKSLHTARLTLRLTDEDLARLEHEMILESLDHLWPWFAFRALPPTLAERVDLAARQHSEALEGKTAHYIVFAGERAVGKVWLDADRATPTLGWWLRATETGQGYATEAVRALVDLAFDRGSDRIEAHTDPENTASRALAERAGLTGQGLSEDEDIRPDGIRRARCIYAVFSPRLGRRR